MCVLSSNMQYVYEVMGLDLVEHACMIVPDMPSITPYHYNVSQVSWKWKLECQSFASAVLKRSHNYHMYGRKSPAGRLSDPCAC